MKTTLKIRADDLLNSLYLNIDDLQHKLVWGQRSDEDRVRLNQLWQTITLLSRYINDTEQLVLEVDTESKTVNLIRQP